MHTTQTSDRTSVRTAAYNAVAERLGNWTAVRSAMCSRDYWVDLRRAHQQGGSPTVDDPTRTA